MKHTLAIAGVCALSFGCAQTPVVLCRPDRRRRQGVPRHRQRDDAEAGQSRRARPAGSSRPSSPTTPKRSPRAPTRRPTRPARDSRRRRCKYDTVQVPADQRRQLNLLKVALVLATPSDPKESDELSKIMARLESAYGKGKWCTDPSKPDTCKNIDDVSRILSSPGDEKALRAAWEGWHTISPPMRKDYQRFVELSNKGAKELGFADTGAMWRSKYDMPPDEFTKELDRLWDQVRPLYLKLHAYVRLKLREKYGDVVPANGPIPAHLLGNLWAQDWSNIYPLVAPPHADPGLLADRHPEEAEDAGARDGPHRRALLHVARLRAAAQDLLRAIAVRPAEGSRGRLPRQRLGHRLRRATSASRCASSRRRRTSRRSTTSSGTTSTSAPTRICRCCSATARTTASTKRSATPSRSR